MIRLIMFTAARLSMNMGNLVWSIYVTTMNSYHFEQIIMIMHVSGGNTSTGSTGDCLLLQVESSRGSIGFEMHASESCIKSGILFTRATFGVGW